MYEKIYYKNKVIESIIHKGKHLLLSSMIKEIFINNQGFWFDPNDLTTLYQDVEGTIPVTAVDQLVGLMKDKSGHNNHAFQTTPESRPILQQNITTGAYYLRFNGIDSHLVTNNIDFTSTDKISLFAGLRKLSDSATAILCELSNASSSTSGTFAIQAPYDGIDKGFAFRSRGSDWDPENDNKYKVPAAPVSAVICGRGDINNDYSEIRVDGITRNINNVEQGTGNYGQYPLYIGIRAGSASPFNGHLYSLIGIGRLTDTNETKNIEKSIAKKVGVSL